MRKSIPTYSFSVVVARLGRRFLLVREAKHGRLWYLPAGRLEPGETYAEAARRETLEEAGVRVVLDGVLRVQHAPEAEKARMRVVFSAHPSDDAPPKSVPDDESLEARWLTLDEIGELPLRSPDALEWCAYVARGGAVHPLGVLTDEQARP